MRKCLSALLAVMTLLFACAQAADMSAMPYYDLVSCMLDEDLWFEYPTEWEVLVDAAGESGFPNAMMRTEKSQIVLAVVVDEAFSGTPAARQIGMSGFFDLGMALIGGDEQSTADTAKVLERLTVNERPAVRADMLGQGYEIIFVQAEDKVFFLLYPAQDAALSEAMRAVAQSVCLTGAHRSGVCRPEDYSWAEQPDGSVAITGYHGDAVCIEVPAELDGKPVTALADQTFYEQPLVWVKLPEGLNAMGTYCFAGCNVLQAVHLPSTLRCIPAGAFESCYRLHELVIPEGVERIEAHALMGCFYLEHIWLPATLREIEPMFANSTPWLNGYTLAAENGYFTTLDNGGTLLSADMTRLIDYAPWQDYREQYDIPEGVEVIDPFAFDHVTDLTEVRLPSTAKELGGMAFAGAALERLYIPAQCTELGVMRDMLVQNNQGELVRQDVRVGLGSTNIIITGVPGSNAQAYAEDMQMKFEPAE